MKLIKFFLFILLVFQSNLSGESTFKEMKESVSRGGWEVIWSKSYGYEQAALLAGCVYIGCAKIYLKSELDVLKAKVGKQILEQALRNKGQVIFGPGNLEVQAGTSFWSTWYWVPISREKLTTARYVRLYVKYRRKSNSSYYLITNKQTDKALDAGGATGNDAYMHPKPTKSNNWHLWKLTKVGKYYLITNKQTGKALDAGGDGGNSVYMYTKPIKNNNWHLWQFR